MMPHEKQGTHGVAGVSQKDKWLVGENESGPEAAPSTLLPPHGSQPARMNSEGGDGAARIDGAPPIKDGKATCTAGAEPAVNLSNTSTPTGVVGLRGPGQLAPTFASAGLSGGGSADAEGRSASRTAQTPSAHMRMYARAVGRQGQIQARVKAFGAANRVGGSSRRSLFGDGEPDDAKVGGKSDGPPPQPGALRRAQSVTPVMDQDQDYHIPNSFQSNRASEVENLEDDATLIIGSPEKGRAERAPKRTKYERDVETKRRALAARRASIDETDFSAGATSLISRATDAPGLLLHERQETEVHEADDAAWWACHEATEGPYSDTVEAKDSAAAPCVATAADGDEDEVKLIYSATAHTAAGAAKRDPMYSDSIQFSANYSSRFAQMPVSNGDEAACHVNCLSVPSMTDSFNPQVGQRVLYNNLEAYVTKIEETDFLDVYEIKVDHQPGTTLVRLEELEPDPCPPRGDRYPNPGDIQKMRNGDTGGIHPSYLEFLTDIKNSTDATDRGAVQLRLNMVLTSHEDCLRTCVKALKILRTQEQRDLAISLAGIDAIEKTRTQSNENEVGAPDQSQQPAANSYDEDEYPDIPNPVSGVVGDGGGGDGCGGGDIPHPSQQQDDADYGGINEDLFGDDSDDSDKGFGDEDKLVALAEAVERSILGEPLAAFPLMTDERSERIMAASKKILPLFKSNLGGTMPWDTGTGMFSMLADGGAKILFQYNLVTRSDLDFIFSQVGEAEAH